MINIRTAIFNLKDCVAVWTLLSFLDRGFLCIGVVRLVVALFPPAAILSQDTLGQKNNGGHWDHSQKVSSMGWDVHVVLWPVPYQFQASLTSFIKNQGQRDYLSCHRKILLWVISSLDWFFPKLSSFIHCICCINNYILYLFSTSGFRICSDEVLG